MTLDELLPLLEKVKGRGGRFTALCPGHDDRNPSLSIQEGERGILLKCWAGCRTEDIVSALGLSIRNLFYDRGTAHYNREAIDKRQREKEETKRIEQAEDRRIDLCREAEATIRAASGIDVSNWTPDEIERAMSALAPAYTILFTEEIKKYVE